MKGKKRKEQRASPDFAVERAGSKVLQKELRNEQEPNKKKLLIDGMECEGIYWNVMKFNVRILFRGKLKC